MFIQAALRIKFHACVTGNLIRKHRRRLSFPAFEAGAILKLRGADAVAIAILIALVGGGGLCFASGDYKASAAMLMIAIAFFMGVYHD